MLKLAQPRRAAIPICVTILGLILASDAYAIKALWGKRSPSSVGGGFSLEGFTCETIPGLGTTSIVRGANGSESVVVEGKVNCTVLGETATEACDFRIEHKNVTDSCITDSSLYPDGVSELFTSVRTLTQSCSTVQDDDITGFIDCKDSPLSSCGNVPISNATPNIACGLRFGILDETEKCETIFDRQPLLELSVGYYDDASCGSDQATRVTLFDLPDGEEVVECGNNIEVIGTREVQLTNAVTADFMCADAGDDPPPPRAEWGEDEYECYAMYYGPQDPPLDGSTAFNGPIPENSEDICKAAGKNVGADTTVNADSNACSDLGRVGSCGFSDDTTGPNETDNVYLRFTGGKVKDVSIDIVDFTDDGGRGGNEGYTMTMEVYADTDFLTLIGSEIFEIVKGSSDGAINNLTVEADGVAAVALLMDGTSGANDKFEFDNGVGYDNVSFEEAEVAQVLATVWRACASNDSSAISPGGFSNNPPAFNPDLNCAPKDDSEEAKGEVGAAIEIPETFMVCSGKFTSRSCGKHKPEIVIPGSALLLGNDIDKSSVEVLLGDEEAKFTCKAREVASIDGNLQGKLSPDTNMDYVCQATCDRKTYNAAYAIKDDDGLALAVLTGQKKLGDDFEVSCNFPVN